MSTDMGLDRATRHATLQRDLHGVPDDLSRMLAPVSKDQLRRAASDGGWGAIEILSHLRDREQIHLDQAAAILAEHDPLLLEPDDTLWEIERSYRTQDPELVLAKFSALRREFTKLLASLPPESWNRSGRHPQFGQLTLAALAERVRAHDRLHVAQIRDALS